MLIQDIARAARVSTKEAKRQVDQYAAHRPKPTQYGVRLTVDGDDIPPPSELTRAEMATILARRMGIGRFAISKKIAERAATAPPGKPREKQVGVEQHPWKLETHGRSVRSVAGGGVMAKLTCSRCPAVFDIKFRQLPGSAEIDRKFIQHGWAVDPAKCPEHNPRHHPKKDSAMNTLAAKTSPAAIAAQAKMFGLLQSHFDVQVGRYLSGQSDAGIAKACGLAVELVAAIRAQVFGELKEPPEIAALAADLATLEGLLTDHETTTRNLRDMLEGSKLKLAELRATFTA
jgi:hypothetical protein